MRTIIALRLFMTALFLALCNAAVADTLFAPIPGTNNVFDAKAWTNGFPSIANGDGIIASNGVFSGAYSIGETTPGTVTVSHVAGTLSATANDWQLDNTGGSAEYHWNQSGGSANIRLLRPGILVTYTLSGTGMIVGTGSGSRIVPLTGGLFRQIGGNLVDMGIEQGFGYTLELIGGNISGCGKNTPTQGLNAKASGEALISISGTHSISFDSALTAANAIVLANGAQLIFDPDWQGSWHRANFTQADWITALSDTGVKVGTTQVTAGNFSDFFTVAREGTPGSTIQLGLREASSAPVLPELTSARLSAHFNASDINNDGGITDPGPGTCVRSWTDLVSDESLLPNVPVAPSFIAVNADGINSEDTLRFSATATSGQILHNSAMVITAQTVFAVATMAENDSNGLSTLLANRLKKLAIRQTTAETASYFAGNSDDFFVQNSTGILHINGNPRLDIPGGFDTPHVVKAVRNSATTYSGFRLSDDAAANRRWHGDIAEVLIFDGKLDGNDTALVNQYLFDKYAIAQVVDERLTDTRQVADAPFRNMRLHRIGVNFYYAPGGDTAGTLHGIGFDNIDLAGAMPPTGPFTLTANEPARTLELDFPFTATNAQRLQSVSTTGTDSSTLNTVINEMFFLGGPAHPSATMTFSGMGVSNLVYVQVFGGDSGWIGHLDVTANGAPVGRWMTVADKNTATASTFAFMAATDASGELELVFTPPPADYFAGIGGIILTEAVPYGPRGTIILIH